MLLKKVLIPKVRKTGEIAWWVPPLGLPDRNEMKAGGQEGALAELINH